MGTRDDGLAALTRLVEARGGTFDRAVDDPRFFDVVSPTGTTSRVKVATKAIGTWQVKKSDRLGESNLGVDYWVMVATTKSAEEAVVMPADAARDIIDGLTKDWLDADPTRNLDNDHCALRVSDVAEWQGRWDLLGLAHDASASVVPSRTVNAETLGAWVFKCNPDVYDLPASIADGETVVENWSVVRNYRSEQMHHGQKAILWVSGPKVRNATRGIWGLGWTTGQIFGVAGLGGGYWLDDEQAADVKWTVPTEIGILDEGERLWADEISVVPALQKLEVFTAPQTSNPSWISKSQLRELEKLLPEWPSLGSITEKPITISKRGAGFGDAESNKLVEEAAMAAVTAYYEDEWEAKVIDVSTRNLGWDLTATTPDGNEWHVEVKGVSGSRPVVLLTANERRVACDDEWWELAIVTGARSKDPVVTVYGGDELIERALPFVWRADMT